MIKKMTDEILDNPKERDAKQKSQEEAVNARKLMKERRRCRMFLIEIQSSSNSKLG